MEVYREEVGSGVLSVLVEVPGVAVAVAVAEASGLYECSQRVVLLVHM